MRKVDAIGHVELRESDGVWQARVEGIGCNSIVGQRGVGRGEALPGPVVDGDGVVDADAVVVIAAQAGVPEYLAHM